MITTRPKWSPEGGRECLASNAFGFWASGSSAVEVVEQGMSNEFGDHSPYVVRISSKGWIPVNVLVFANGKERAIERVLEHLEYVKDNSPKRTDRHRDLLDPGLRASELLAKLASGKLKVEVSSYPIHQISKVQWAGNDGVIT